MIRTAESTAVRYERGDDGIVVLVLDDPGRSANTMNARYTASMQAVLERLDAECDGLTGVIVTSAKKTFFAGGDLDTMGSARTAEEVFESSRAVKGQLRRLETLGVPVVACLNGAALGGGLEIALACHHRIAADVRGCVVGLPEVTLGLLPGGGGVVRTVRMLGLVEALTKVLTSGTRFAPRAALELGLIDEVVDSVEDLVPAARAWLATSRPAAQSWDQPGYRVPGGTPTSGPLATVLPTLPAVLRRQLRGAPVESPLAILAAAVEGLQVDVDTAFDIEGRYFVGLVRGQLSKNMTKAFFHDLQQVNGGGQRPEGVERAPVTRAGVLGAGMMGAGIAYAFARSGVEVVLKDVTLEAAQRGVAHSRALCERAAAQGRTTPHAAAALLARITPTADGADLAGCDVIVEAVFETTELKHAVLREAERHALRDALLASNTSTLPITGLAEGVERPEDVVGLHFFSPVDRMPLVEIIRGARSSDRALARAFDVVRLLGKTPIVVNDSRGLFTSRVIGTFLDEGLSLLAEGMHPASLEQACLQAGYPAPVLQLLDELGLTLARTVRERTRQARVEAGQAPEPTLAARVVETMVVDHHRNGRAAGAGFYDYENGRRTRLWPGLLEAFGGTPHAVPFEVAQERMLFVEALETVRCFDEGVITSVADANVGSILGIGFPAWTGGVVQYVEQYAGGVAGFVRRADELAGTCGERFRPPASLRQRATTSPSTSVQEPA